MTNKQAHPSVMIVDDEESVRRILRRILEPAGYDVTEAHGFFIVDDHH